MTEIAIYAPEVFKRAVELIGRDRDTEYERGIVDLVARVIYPELAHESAVGMAFSRLSDYRVLMAD